MTMKPSPDERSRRPTHLVCICGFAPTPTATQQHPVADTGAFDPLQWSQLFLFIGRDTLGGLARRILATFSQPLAVQT
jgi:hypothetical protein